MSRHFPPLPYQLRADLFLHLAALEKAGLPADKAFAVLDTAPAARARLATMRRLLARRVDLASAGLNSGLFTSLEARLVRAALDAGSPLPSYQRLASRHAAHASQLARIRSRAMLPLVTFALALLVQPLPRLVAGTIQPGAYFLQSFGPLLLCCALAALAVRLQRSFVAGAAMPGRAFIERCLPRLPLFGAMHRRACARDFVENLAMLLQAGVPMFDALPAARATVSNALLREDYGLILPAMQDGATLAQALARLDLPDSEQLVGFALSGEQSGTLPDMLARHASEQGARLYQFQDQLSQWLPRLLYAAVAAWMVSQLLGAPAKPAPDTQGLVDRVALSA
jgi:general secretion pathway protein F